MTNKKQKYDDIILMQFADNELDKKTYKQLEEDLKTNNELQKRLSVYTLTRSALKNKENYQIPDKLNKLIDQGVENKKILRFIKKHHFQFPPASVNFTLAIVFFGVLTSLITPIIKNKMNVSESENMYKNKILLNLSTPSYNNNLEYRSSLQSLDIDSLLKPGMHKIRVVDLIGPPDKIIVIEKNEVSVVISEWNYSYNAQKENGVWILKFIGNTLLEITKKVYSHSK